MLPGASRQVVERAPSMRYTYDSMADFNLQFVSKTHLTSDIWRFDFAKAAELKFTAGQYLEYSLPHPDMDDRGTKRYFTISAAPTDQVISITTRIFERMSSFKHALNSLEAGASIYATGPDGDFTLPADKTRAVVLIAGGIGVTPYHSQIQELLDTAEDDTDGQKQPITLIYGAKTTADFVYSDVFERAAGQLPHFQLIRVLGESDPSWHETTGQITDQLIQQATPDVATTDIYVSGPEAMVEAFKPRLLKLGFSNVHIHQDWFPGYIEHF